MIFQDVETQWVISGGAGLVVVYVLLKYASARHKQKILDKWSAKSRNGKVVLHGMYGNSEFLPTVSPFVLKVETFLRLAKIPYDIDKSDFWGPKGKTPWISYNGKNVADSQFIVEFLGGKFGITLSNKLTKRERAMGTMARVMVEEHLYWAGVMWRFAFGGRDTFQHVLKREKTFSQWIIFRLIASQMKAMAWSQGLGRHSEAEVKEIMLQDLRAISELLGNNKFLLGNEPCDDDCAVFAGLASAVFTPNSPVQQEMNGELKNLKEYCYRMKEMLWPDWNIVINNSNNK